MPEEADGNKCVRTIYSEIEIEYIPGQTDITIPRYSVYIRLVFE